MARAEIFERIKLRGDILTVHNCREVVHSIRRSLSEGHTQLELDFSEVDQITGSFTGFLAQILHLIREVGGRLFLSGANDEVSGLLQVLGFGQYVKEK